MVYFDFILTELSFCYLRTFVLLSLNLISRDIFFVINIVTKSFLLSLYGKSQHIQYLNTKMFLTVYQTLLITELVFNHFFFLLPVQLSLPRLQLSFIVQI